MILFGFHYEDGWCTTQQIIALSSGEAEYLAMNYAAARGLLCQVILKGLGVDTTLHVGSDSSAARGMVQRIGIGMVRHLSRGALFVDARGSQGGQVQAP